MRHLEAREIVAGDRRIGCNVERPAYGQWPALSGEYLSGAGEKGERPEPRYPSPTRSRGSGSLFAGFSLLESDVGPGDGSPGSGAGIRGGFCGLATAPKGPEKPRSRADSRQHPGFSFAPNPIQRKERPRPVFRLGPLWFRSCQFSRFALRKSEGDLRPKAGDQGSYKRK